jgi:hypothetical protein
LILFSTLSYLQNNSDFDVFKKIIEHESGTGVLGLYVHENLKLLWSSFRRKRTKSLKNILRDIEINVAKVVTEFGIWINKTS